MDIEHIHKTLSGDTEAFRYFTKVYQSMCHSIAISMVKNEADAKDVVQNSFIRAFKSLRSFRQESKFSSWLYKIVVNESLKQIKKKKIQTHIYSLDETYHEQVITFNDAISSLDKDEKKKAIYGVLRIMKPKEALVLKLFYLHEQTIQEIVSITGFKENNIKVLLHRARKSFAALFIKSNSTVA